MPHTTHQAGMLPELSMRRGSLCASAFARVVQKIDKPPVELSAAIWALGSALRFNPLFL